MILPPEAHPLVQVLALHFTGPTYQRLSTLLAGALLTTGRRTVANLLRTLRHLAPGHRTSYQRVLSRAVVRAGARMRAGPVPPAALRSRRPGRARRRRHRRWAQGQ